MQFVVLAPVVALLGAPAGAHPGIAAFKVVLTDEPPASQPREAPAGMVEPSTRVVASWGPRIPAFLTVPCVSPGPIGLAESRLYAAWPIPTDSTEATPRSPRAPPAA